jgi:putative heme iron utilization protein
MTNDAHGRPSGAALSFTPDAVQAPSHAERARTLVAQHGTGTLCTLALEPAGYPYGSFVTFALHEGQPVFLISRIAEHTRNLEADGRASLLVNELGKADPLANGRVTLLGETTRVARDANELPALRSAFLAAHPQASYYVDYQDFDFYRLQLASVRYIGGYGRMSWVEADDFRRAQPDALISASAGILAHMNQDHADSLLRYARAFTRATDAVKAVMTAVDRYGFELTISTPAGLGAARLAFDAPLASAADARVQLIALARRAEASLGE